MGSDIHRSQPLTHRSRMPQQGSLFAFDLPSNRFVPTAEEDWYHLDRAAIQLFHPSAPIEENDLFAGRITQANGLLDAIYQKGQHAVLFGERGVGKTSLSNIVEKRVLGESQYYKFIKINCTRA